MDKYNKRLDTEELYDRLNSLDEELALKYPNLPYKFNCYIVGSCALIFQRYLQRTTVDIDVMDASTEILSILPKYDINSCVTAFYDNFTDSYIDRAVQVPLSTHCIDFYTASLEDMITAKLASYRDKDWDDITQPAILAAVDIDKLRYVIDEVSIDMLSDRRLSEFKWRADKYIELLQNPNKTSLF